MITPSNAVLSRSPAISVLVVDDSAIVRGLIGRLIDDEPDLSLAGSASSAAMALSELRRRPADVILLDIEMPVMDGLSALPLLLAACPGARVLIVSSLSRRNAEISLNALQLGAADCLPKPDGGPLVSAENFKRELVGRIRALGRRTPRATPAPPAAPTPAAAPRTRAKPTVIAIGGSTGAPPVLMQLFEAMEGHVRQPILVTQHMPPTFTAILAEQLARVGGRPAAEAVDGEAIQPGRVYVAPGGWHMTAVKVSGAPVIRLNQGPPEHFCRPAVDPMLRSLAEVYGAGVLALILTGMGADGAKGCEAVARAGGRFIVQDEATSAVWGMPGAAAKTGLAERVLPAARIAPFLVQASEASL